MAHTNRTFYLDDENDSPLARVVRQLHRITQIDPHGGWNEIGLARRLPDTYAQVVDSKRSPEDPKRPAFTTPERQVDILLQGASEMLRCNGHRAAAKEMESRALEIEAIRAALSSMVGELVIDLGKKARALKAEADEHRRKADP